MSEKNTKDETTPSLQPSQKAPSAVNSVQKELVFVAKSNEANRLLFQDPNPIRQNVFEKDSLHFFLDSETPTQTQLPSAEINHHSENKEPSNEENPEWDDEAPQESDIFFDLFGKESKKMDSSVEPKTSSNDTPTRQLSSGSGLAHTIINNRFQISHLIGQGGMGKVYLAKQLPLGREVVIKLLHPHLAEDAVRKERFHREAKAMTSFIHPNAVTVFDFGEWDGQLYIAMEYLKGESLSAFMKRVKHVPLEMTIEIMRQMCDVLEEAHKAGFIHRDLKPENVMIMEKVEGIYDDESEDKPIFIKLVDFGLAFYFDADETVRLTAEGMALGTPCYMSPEQARGLKLDVRTDIYALGVMLYELLCGELPFQSKKIMDLMMQHIFEQPKAFKEIRPDLTIPPQIEELTFDALSKKKAARPISAKNFQERLLDTYQKHLNQMGFHSISSLGQIPRFLRSQQLGIQAPVRLSEQFQSKDSNELPVHTIAIVETFATLSQSIAVSLLQQGFTAESVKSLEEAYDWIQEQERNIVGILVCFLDTNHPQQSFFDLMKFRHKRKFMIPTIGIGPDDCHDVMTQMLEEKCDYIPLSLLESQLPKSLKRIIRKSSKK